MSVCLCVHKCVLVLCNFITYKFMATITNEIQSNSIIRISLVGASDIAEQVKTLATL